MISEDLLSAVLDKEIIEVKPSRNKSTMFYVWNDRAMAIEQEINLYELAHKCKEWSLNKNIKVYSLLVKDGGKCNIHRVQKDEKIIDKTFKDISEPEAIFKACEYILKDLK